MRHDAQRVSGQCDRERAAVGRVDDRRGALGGVVAMNWSWLGAIAVLLLLWALLLFGFSDDGSGGDDV
jgi:hypothetical protein